MQIDQNPFPVHTIELANPKVLIRPHQAKSAKGKNVIVGEERPEKKVLQSKTVSSPASVFEESCLCSIDCVEPLPLSEGIDLCLVK